MAVRLPPPFSPQSEAHKVSDRSILCREGSSARLRTCDYFPARVFLKYKSQIQIQNDR